MVKVISFNHLVTIVIIYIYIYIYIFGKTYSENKIWSIYNYIFRFAKTMFIKWTQNHSIWIITFKGMSIQQVFKNVNAIFQIIVLYTVNLWKLKSRNFKNILKKSVLRLSRNYLMINCTHVYFSKILIICNSILIVTFQHYNSRLYNQCTWLITITEQNITHWWSIGKPKIRKIIYSYYWRTNFILYFLFSITKFIYQRKWKFYKKKVDKKNTPLIKECGK